MADNDPIPQLRRFRDDEDPALHNLLTGNAWLHHNGKEVEFLRPDDDVDCTVKDQRTFPPGCTCERINVDTFADVPGTQFVRGRSDPPCKVHLPKERALYDVAYERGFQVGGGLER